jgi:hypothetical protein
MAALVYFNFFEISRKVIHYTTKTPTSLRSDWFESWCTAYITTSKSGIDRTSVSDLDTAISSFAQVLEELTCYRRDEYTQEN